MTEPNESLEFFWEGLGVLAKDAAPTPESLGLEPNDMAIGTSRNRLLVVIKPNGTLKYGPDYQPDEAAQIFWEALASRRIQYEERMLVIRHMEQLLRRVGQQDLECERLRGLANEDNLEAQVKAQREQYAELAIRRLEMYVHDVIELGRALVTSVDPIDPPT